MELLEVNKTPEKKKRPYKKRKSQENVNKGNVDDIAWSKEETKICVIMLPNQ